MINEPNEKQDNLNNLTLEKSNSENDKTFSKSTNQLSVVSTTGYRITTEALSENFFENLLILEMELEEEFSLEKIIELIKQYSLAIAYYSQYEPKKSKAYQNRMEYLLTNKDTLVKLKKQNVKNNNINSDNNDNNNINNKIEMNREKKEKNKIKSELNVDKNYVKIQKDEIKYEVLSRKATLVLISNKNKNENKISGKNIIKEDLEKQSLNWKEKLKHKKKKQVKFNVKPNIDNFKKKYLGDNTIDKVDLSLSLNPKFFSENLAKINNENNSSTDLKISKFNSDELNNDIKDNEINNNDEKIKENEELIKQIKIDDKNDENNIENEREKPLVNKDNENKIIQEEDKKEVGNIINEKQLIDNTKEKEKDKNEIKEEAIKKEEKPNINTISSENLALPDNNDIVTNLISTLPSSSEQLEKIYPDTEITTSIDALITSLKNEISHLDIEEEEDSEFSNSNKNIINIKNTNNNNDLIGKIPTKFKETYSLIESIIHNYMKEFNLFFYQDIFELFSSSLKELYELKYKKYIEIKNEYHAQIKENEYILENEDNLTNERKEQYQQTIESLNEELQHQIEVVEDEFNKKIMDKISEFKLNSFKHNSGIQLLEEKLKLDVYSLINNAFYN